jgi:hypothetical protein
MYYVLQAIGDIKTKAGGQGQNQSLTAGSLFFN